MQIFIFISNSRGFYDGGTAVVVAENFDQAKKLLTNREISLYDLQLSEILEIDELSKTPRVLGAYVHTV